MTAMFLILSVVFTVIVPLFIVVVWEIIEIHRYQVRQRAVKFDVDLQAKLSAALSRERELRAQLAECHKQLALEEKKNG